MGLGKGVFDIPFAPLNQTPPEHGGPIGRVQNLKNVIAKEYDAGKRPVRLKLQQRNGFRSLVVDGTDPVTGEATTLDWAGPELLAPLGDQPLAVAKAIPRVFNGATWTVYDDRRVVANRLSQSVFHTSQRTIQAPDSAWLAGVTCCVWSETVMTTAVYGDGQIDVPSLTLWIGFKSDNGAWIIPPRKLTDPGLTAHEDPFWLQPNLAMARVVSDGVNFWVVFNSHDGADAVLTIQCYSTEGVLAAETNIAQPAPIVAGIGYWDIARKPGSDGDGITIVQPQSTTSDAGVKFTGAILTVDSITVAETVFTGAHSTGPVAFVTNDFDTNHYWFATWADGSLYGYRSNLIGFSHQYIFPDVNEPDSITGFLIANPDNDGPDMYLSVSQLSTVAQAAGPTYDPQRRFTSVFCCDWNGAISFIRQINSLIQVSRAFLHDGEYYAFTYYQSGSGVSNQQRSLPVDIQDGDYMIGQAEQEITVADGDYVTGSPISASSGPAFAVRPSMAHGVENLAGGDHYSAVNSTYADNAPLYAWTFANMSMNPQMERGLLHVESTGTPADGDWPIVTDFGDGKFYTRRTAMDGHGGTPGSITSGNIEVISRTSYSLPDDFAAIPLNTVPFFEAAPFVGSGNIVVTGNSDPDNNGTFDISQLILQTRVENPTFGQYAPMILVLTDSQSNNNSPCSIVINQRNPRRWVINGADFGSQDVGNELELVGGVAFDSNRGEFEITSVPLNSIAVTGAADTMTPEIFVSPFPTLVMRLSADVTPLTFKLQDLTLDYTFIGAVMAISGSPHETNNGSYIITQINDDGTFIAAPANGNTGQVSQRFQDETITIFFSNQIAPQFQPSWFMTPLRGAPPGNTVLAPVAWYRSSDGVTITSGKVSGWADQTSNHFDVAQSNADLRPTIEDNIFGTLPGIRFANTTDGNKLDHATQIVAPGSDRTILALCKPDSYFGGTICTFQSSAKAFNALWETLGGPSGTQYVYSDDTPGASEPPNALYTDAAPIDDSNVRLVMSWRCASLAFDVRRNGADVVISGTPEVLTDDGTPHWRIGNQYNGIIDRGWSGWIGELIVFDQALSDADLAFWTTYLQNRGV